jgi:hypothetical protein
VELDLVDRREHGGAIEKRREVLDHEVADSDRADLVVSVQRLQGTVGLQGAVERRRQRLVQDHQVDLFDAELTGALLETRAVGAHRSCWASPMRSPSGPRM